MRERAVLVISGPSAGGKTTLAAELLQEGSPFESVRSMTTRAVRGDKFDSEYIYLGREEFLARAEQGELLEYAEYSGDLYGTPRSELERILAKGKVPLLVLNLDGVRAFAANAEYSSCRVYVFCDPNVAEQRLYDRYIGTAPTPAGLASFVRRKEQNLCDYLTLPTLAPLFFDAIQNDGTVEAGAEALRRSFEGYIRGEDSRTGEVESSFAALEDFARRKSGNGE